MRILSIDLGKKRIGLAISDPLGITAQGLPTLNRKNDTADFDSLRQLCASRSVEKCIVGLPLMMNGEVGTKAKETIEWIGQLKTVLPCPVETWDERLTTREALRTMIAQGLSRKKQKEKNDQLAAILILQNFLDHQRPREDD